MGDGLRGGVEALMDHPSIVGMLGHVLWMMLKPVLVFGALLFVGTLFSRLWRGGK